jgi:ABC-2 type transport system ATP-binding protein
MQLSFDNVTKLYGPVIGVNNISCHVGPGITGLFGSNGAGKSTMLKLASGQLRPTQGEVRIGQHHAWSSRAKRDMGLSPDLNHFYEEMSGRAFVNSMARLYGYPRKEARLRTEYVLEEVGMADRASRTIAGMSHGMRQRIKLAQALVNDPPVLLLDEPMTGIDPGGRRDISEVLTRQAATGKTILFSSHILVELEHVADSILMIARGRIIASGKLNDVRNLIDDEPFTVEIISEESRRLAPHVIEISIVESVSVRGDSLIVRTRTPQQFFARIGEIVLEQDLQVQKMHLLDTGADAVFGYLEGTQP